VGAVATREPSGAVMERPQLGSQPLFDDGVTLEDRILRVWEDLVAEGRADCPVCGGSMTAGSGCRDCGAALN
jgi:hypothetical protein